MAQVPHGPTGGAPGSPQPPPQAPVQDGLPPRERVLAMAAIGLAMTMAVLDGAIVNVALPVMAKDLSVRPADAIFVVNAYQVAVTASLLPFAALGDIFGFRKVYLPGLAVFVAASSPARSRRTCRS